MNPFSNNADRTGRTVLTQGCTQLPCHPRWLPTYRPSRGNVNLDGHSSGGPHWVWVASMSTDARVNNHLFCGTKIFFAPLLRSSWRCSVNDKIGWYTEWSCAWNLGVFFTVLSHMSYMSSQVLENFTSWLDTNTSRTANTTSFTSRADRSQKPHVIFEIFQGFKNQSFHKHSKYNPLFTSRAAISQEPHVICKGSSKGSRTNYSTRTANTISYIHQEQQEAKNHTCNL